MAIFAKIGYLIRENEITDVRQYNEKRDIVINVEHLIFVRPNNGQIKLMMSGNSYFLLDVVNPNETAQNILQRINAL